MFKNEDKIESIMNDHNYTVLHWNNNNSHTIDDNITNILSIDQSFGVLHYENDSNEVIFF